MLDRIGLWEYFYITKETITLLLILILSGCSNYIQDSLNPPEVAIYPNPAMVRKGGNRQFRAVVGHPATRNGSQQVRWTVTGNNDAETTISPEGVLKASRNETADTLTVTAYAEEGWTETGSESITVSVNPRAEAEWNGLVAATLALALSNIDASGDRGTLGNPIVITILDDIEFSGTTSYVSSNLHIKLTVPRNETKVIKRVSVGVGSPFFNISSSSSLILEGNGEGKLVLDGGAVWINRPSPARDAVNDATAGGLSASASLIKTEGGTFTMNAGAVIQNNINTAAGGGVDVSSGTFIMNGGIIANNKTSTNGGGVNVSSGTFTMNGGIITGNKADTNGGGVYISGTFNKTGGVIYGISTPLTNYAGSGSAVYIGTSSYNDTY